MYCIHCGAYSPDNALFYPNCGKKQVSGAPPNQPLEISAQITSPEQQSFTEQPSLQQPTISGPASSNNGKQLWEAFGDGSSSDRQPLPHDEMSSEIPQMPTPEPNLPTESTGPVTPLPAVHAPRTRVLEPRFGVLAKPLPLWATLPAIAVIILGLVALQLTGSDWAAGTLHVAIVIGIIGLLVALATGIRALAGLRQLKRLIGSGLAVLILLMLSGVGLTQQSTIHSWQAHNWEGQQQWQSAINEFQLAGEGAPTSDNISRVYNEWGEQFSAIQHYQEAFPKFDIVLNNYSLATAEVARAQVDKTKAYFGWAQQALQQHDYRAATMRLDALLQLPYCDANCQSQANALDATAYYNLAELQLSAQQYDTAITSFQTVLTRFPSSPEAQKVHADFAKALFGQGQQQLTTSCPSAIPTYQRLSTQFADTPEGQKATTALKAPQKVKGRFTGSIPNDPSLTRVAALMKGLYTGISSDQLATLFYSSPRTTIANDGSFVFGPQPQGSYELAWGTTVNATGGGVLTWNTARYVADVGPLCPYDFGDIYENIPTSS
jgi:tetratricopeptide (TPR) repeat protein